MDRDFQKNRVYAWEQQWVAPKIRDSISFETAVQVGLYVWDQLGLKHPPLFKPLSKKAKCGGMANRLSVWLPEKTSTWIVLHELSHSLTCDLDGNSARHGEDFVGVYCRLLDRFTGISIPELLYTMDRAGVKFNLGAGPVMFK